MKRVLLSLVCLISFALLGHTQTSSIVNPNAPQIKFEKEVIDYGEIEQGSDPFRIFKFTNTGKSPLIIHTAIGSCGCTVPTWPKEPIKPGGFGEIKVKYDTKRLGIISRTVTVTTNASVPSTTLRIKGKVLIAKAGNSDAAKGEHNNGQSVVH